VKSISILAAALAAGTLFAQAPGSSLDARVLLFGEVERPSAFIVDQVGTKDQASDQWGGGIRFMGEIASAPGWYYELGGKFDASSNLVYRGNVTPTYYLDNTDVRIDDSYWSLGGAYLFNMGPVALGLHLEARGERLEIVGTVYDNTGAGIVAGGTYDATNTYLRPWGRISLDYSWRMGNARPFFGADAALAFFHSSQTIPQALAQVDDRTLRSMAPRSALSIYLGMHF
jgi:hypothetical protein